MKTSDELIKVIIIDDHRLFNDGLNMMLTPSDSVIVMAQVYDSRLAQQKIEELKPDVVLMDFNMPHINGIDLTKLLLSQDNSLKILTLSMYNEDMYIDAFRKAGSKGYLFKTASLDEVIMAIRKVFEGGYYFPETNAKKSNHTEDDFLKKLKLSAREIEVIKLVKEGLKTKEIAEKLNISFYTAETHRKNIKLKIGLKGEAEFLKFVYEKW